MSFGLLISKIVCAYLLVVVNIVNLGRIIKSGFVTVTIFNKQHN